MLVPAPCCNFGANLHLKDISCHVSHLVCFFMPVLVAYIVVICGMKQDVLPIQTEAISKEHCLLVWCRRCGRACSSMITKFRHIDILLS